MLYSTIASLINASSEKLLIQLTDESSTGVYNVDILNQAMLDAQEEMDPYLRRRYSEQMPFDPVPGILTAISDDISLYRLHKRRIKIPDSFQKAYDQAVDKLKNISKELMDLGTSAGSVAEDNDSVTFTNKTPEDRKFRDPEGY